MPIELVLAAIGGIILISLALIGTGFYSLHWYFRKIEEGEREYLIDSGTDEPAPVEDVRRAA